MLNDFQILDETEQYLSLCPSRVEHFELKYEMWDDQYAIGPNLNVH